MEKLINWHEDNFSNFPWRSSTDPYQILVTEMLLRKTSRKQVSLVYSNFFRAFPTPSSLASADVRSIRRQIKELGMQNKRSLLLKRMARALLKFGGSSLWSKDELMTLPGVGDYTASAIHCMINNDDSVMLDTNVIRILSRVFSIPSSRTRVRDDRGFHDVALSLIPSGRARQVNLAMIDLGAKTCTARSPHCHVCPLNGICDYYKLISIRMND